MRAFPRAGSRSSARSASTSSWPRKTRPRAVRSHRLPHTHSPQPRRARPVLRARSRCPARRRRDRAVPRCPFLAAAARPVHPARRLPPDRAHSLRQRRRDARRSRPARRSPARLHRSPRLRGWRDRRRRLQLSTPTTTSSIWGSMTGRARAARSLLRLRCRAPRLRVRLRGRPRPSRRPRKARRPLRSTSSTIRRSGRGSAIKSETRRRSFGSGGGTDALKDRSAQDGSSRCSATRS